MEIATKIQEAQEHFRKGYAILAEIDAFLAPNIREEVRHHENLALLADHPKPSPLPAIGPPIPVKAGEPEEVE